MTASPGTAFYVPSSDLYFLGAVAMINSLRLQGHDERVYVTDLGLEPWQRDLLATEARFVAAPPGVPPWLSKTVAPLAHPHETMVLVDADIAVTRPLGDLIACAAAGDVVAFENDTDRWVDEWGEILGLGELERRRYLCSGFLAVAAEPGIRILETMERCQGAVEFGRSFFAADEPGYALRFIDQDVLNAVISSLVPRERVAGLDSRLMSPLGFGAAELADARTLRCVYPDGAEPWIVHHILPDKPWLKPVYTGVYSRLLIRLLNGSDVPIRVPAAAIPLQLREGRLGRLMRARISARDRLGWFAREHLPASVFDRYDAIRGAAVR